MTEQIKVESEITFTIVPHWLLDVCTPIEISTYIALGKYANNKTKECWPSVATISKEINRAKKNTIKALQGLEEKGAIEIYARSNEKTGQQTSNLYILKINQGGLQKRNTPSNEIVMGGSNENVTQTILNRTIHIELYSREVQTMYVDTVQEVCGMDKPTKTQWGKIYASAKQLHEAGYVPDDIPVIAENIIKTYGLGALTPQGIVNNVHLISGARSVSGKEVTQKLEENKLKNWANDN